MKRATKANDKHASGLPLSYARGSRGGTEGMHLLRLQYTSRLIAPAGVEEGRQIIKDILRTSVHHNSAMTIGGLLCFNPRDLSVVQVLEGPPFALKSLYERIKADSRHTDIVLTSEEILFNRADCHFDAGWGMLQSESLETGGLLDLSARLQRAYDSRSVAGQLKRFSAAQSDARQQLMDEATGGAFAAASA